MKLLLTSTGIVNQKLASALQKLTGKSPSETKIGVIPTAANVEDGNKDWFIAQLTKLQTAGFNWIDVVDPSADVVDWQNRLTDVDVIFVSGGNTFHLLDQIRKTGFDNWLKQNLNHKVYVGVSAGSIIAGPTIAISTLPPGDPNLSEITDLTGLGLVDFEVSPHTPEAVSVEANQTYASAVKNVVYALNDQSAIKVDGARVEVISEGKYLEFNKNENSKFQIPNSSVSKK